MSEHTISIETLSEKRQIHSRSVAYFNLYLNERFRLQLDERDLYLSGLYHDIAREWSEERLRTYIRENRIELVDEERKVPALLHAPVGACYLRECGFNSVITSAVRWHTLGCASLSGVGKVLFVSDYMEPARTHLSEEQRVELLESRSLDEIIVKIITRQERYFREKGRV